MGIKTIIEHNRNMDVFLKKFLIGMALIILTGLGGSTVTFIKMGEAVEALEKKDAIQDIAIKSQNKVTIEDSRSILSMGIKQEQVIKDIDALKKGQEKNKEVLLKILQEVTRL